MTPLLRELIVASLTLAESYAPGSRDERIYELILDEIRGMAVLPFGLPEPQSEALRRLCQKVREAPGEPWSSAEAAKESSMSERTLNRHFQQQTSLTERVGAPGEADGSAGSPGTGTFGTAGGAGSRLR